MSLKQKKWNKKEQEATEELGFGGDTMTFHEIADALNMTVFEVKRIYGSAMRKLRIPNEKNRIFWEYVNISSKNESSDMSGTSL